MNQIKVGAIVSYISIAVNILIGIVYTPWMINSIGKESYGLYILATSVITLFMFDFGLGNAVTRFVSKYIVEKRYDKVNDFLGQVVKLYLSIDVVLIIVLTSVYFFIPSIYKELSPNEIEQFEVVYSIAAIFSVISFPCIPFDGIITAQEKFVQLKSCELFNKIFIVILMSICLKFGYGLYALVAINAISGIITICLKFYIIKRSSNINPNIHYKNKDEFYELASYSSWVTIGALAQRLIFNIAPTILGIVSGSAEIAFFGIAMTFEGYVFTFASALNGLFLPTVTRLVHSSPELLTSLMIRVGRIQIVIIGLLITGFIAVGYDFIVLWLGMDYSIVYYCVILLIIPSFFFLPQLIGSNAILALNKVKKQAQVYTIMGLFNFVVGTILAYRFGALGFSISVFCAYTIRTIGLDRIFKKDLHIDVPYFFKESYIAMSPSLLISMFIALTLMCIDLNLSWWSFVVKSCVFCIIYILIFFIFSLRKEEKQLFIQPFRKLQAFKTYEK